MAVTNEYSSQLAKVFPALAGLDDAPGRVEAHELHGRLRIAHFDFTQGAAAGDIGSTAELTKLTGGAQRILADLSKVYFSAFGAARTLDIGLRAYTNADGTVVAEDPDALNAALDVSAAGSATIGTTLQDETDGGSAVYDSRDGVTVFATVAGGTIPAGARIAGQIVYVVD